MKSQYTRLRGMPDLMPSVIAPWQRLENAVRHAMQAYGYGEMRTPLLERTSLFQRSIGEATDIVEKEMYTFSDRKGESMSLRPENTAGCVRAAIENGLLQPGSVNRVWYSGPMFRYERPQLGRQRQFHQVGAEVYGLSGAEIEVELILLSARLWKELKIQDAMVLEVNTLGDLEDRARYREKLIGYLNNNKGLLDEDSLRRLDRNPLRILDSKNPDMQDMINAAPKLMDSLSDASRDHFDSLRESLVSCGINPVVNPRLVRGLDYYSHTVFEWTTDQLGSQSAVCAGGRYDGLLEQLGAKAMPGVGWAFGMERVIALMDKLQQLPEAATPDVYVMSTGDVPFVSGLSLAEELRRELPHASVLHNTQGGSLKSQFRKADKSGAKLAAILGAEELAAKRVSLKVLRGSSSQTTVERNELAAAVSNMLDTL